MTLAAAKPDLYGEIHATLEIAQGAASGLKVLTCLTGLTANAPNYELLFSALTSAHSKLTNLINALPPSSEPEPSEPSTVSSATSLKKEKLEVPKEEQEDEVQELPTPTNCKGPTNPWSLTST